MSDTVRRDAWRDKTNVPTTYNGQQFRSIIEADVARFLDECAVHWRYEAWTDYTRHYLPDFTIDWAPECLGLPRWIEVKPQEMLYDLRDALGVPELFQGDHRIEDVSAADILNLNEKFAELYKPKRLAEVAADDLCETTPLSSSEARTEAGIGVLVAAAANRTRTLSIEMDACGITLSRCHPFVNYKGVQRQRERDQREERWAAEAAVARAEYERQRVEREERNRRAWAAVGEAIRLMEPRQARYDGQCRRCAQRFAAAALLMWRYDDQWLVLCGCCRQAVAK